MSEPTRMTAPSGGSKDVKIERYDQIPTYPLAELAARYGIGYLKYADKDGLNNWLHGYPWSWSYRALIGHANAFWAGEDVDEATYVGTDNESPFDEKGDPRPGVQHLAAVAWHAFALLEWMETHPENDDRVSTVKARLAAGLSPNEDAEPASPNEVKPDQLVDHGGWPAPERIEEIQAALRNAGIAVWNRPVPVLKEDDKYHLLLELDDEVRVELEGGRIIERAIISGIKKVAGKIRYDVTYGVDGWGRLNFVPPSQITLLDSVGGVL